jgi:DNA topoisomerase VI subunit A
MQRTEMNVSTGEIVHIPYTTEEQAEYNSKKAAWDAGANTRKAAEVRAERNDKLTATDWTQTLDTPQVTKDKYATYRQALRDVPSQAGFPWTIEWPEQP